MMHSPFELRFLALTLSTLSFVFSSCETTPEKPIREPVKVAERKPAPAPKTPVKQITRPIPKPIPTVIEYNSFYSRMSIPEHEYTESDRQMLATFPPNPSAGSIHEAALVLGLLRDVLTPLGMEKASSTPTFNSTDTTPSTAVNTTNPNSVVAPPSQPTGNLQATGLGDQSRVIEFRARAVGVDLVSALASNPYLKSHAIFNLASDASRIEGNSQVFVQNLSTVIKSEVQLWADMFRRLGLDMQPVAVGAAPANLDPEPTQNSPQAAPQSVVPTPTTAGAPLTPAQNAAAIKSLATARELAQKEQFAMAIIESRKIPPGADNYVEAQENTKNWANRVVQDLRRQAATQYTAGRNNPDNEGKKLNLTKSKNFLEQAIAKYPEASTLDTVKENLAIIESELAHLM